MRSQRRDDVHTIFLHGELDLLNAGAVEQELVRAESTDAATIVINLAGVTFIDSTGVRLLIMACARSRTNRYRLELTQLSDEVRRVLAICGLLTNLPISNRERDDPAP